MILILGKLSPVHRSLIAMSGRVAHVRQEENVRYRIDRGLGGRFGLR